MRIAIRQSGVFKSAADRLLPAAGSRVLHLEALRLVAIILVVYNHTSTRGFLLFTSTQNRLPYAFYLGLSILCKIAVPLFFMVSGALLIPRDESIRAMYRKRVLRMVVVIVLAMLAMYAYNVHTGIYGFDPLVFLKYLYSSPLKVATAYWFLYAYLAILLLLPFIRPMARGMSNRAFVYLLILQLFFAGVIPIFDYLVGYAPPFLPLPLFVELGQAFFFFVMGYFLEHRLTERAYRPRNAYLAVGAAFVAICISGCMTWLRFRIRGGGPPEAIEAFFGGFIALPTLAVYFLAKYGLRGRAVAPWVVRLILWFGAAAFGTYLLDSALRPTIAAVFTGLQPHLGSFFSCAVWVLCVVVAGSLITSALKLLPWLNRLL